MSDLQRNAMKKSLGIPPLPSRLPGRGGGGWHARRQRRDYTPVAWDHYFEKRKDVGVKDKDLFRVYFSGNEGPLLLLLHGGGHSALSWAVFTEAVTKLCQCQVLAFDIRGHGDTKTSDDKDLSADRLADDVGDLVTSIYGDSPPPILLIGHSMGGAIAVHVGVKQLLPSLIGLTLIDVVEGTALDALSSMQNFLKSRPEAFKSLEHGIEWSVRSGQIHNVQSARVSMAGQLVRCNDSSTVPPEPERHPTPPHGIIDAITEQEDEDGEEDRATTSKDTHQQTAQDNLPVQNKKAECWKWRIDLSGTEQYWKGWFTNMSKLFLSVEVPKLLLLAGVDRLDKELTIGQMQGKFQMILLPQCGHCVHEDAPDKVAEVIVTFLLRYKLTEAKGDFVRPIPAC